MFEQIFSIYIWDIEWKILQILKGFSDGSVAQIGYGMSLGKGNHSNESAATTETSLYSVFSHYFTQMQSN